MGKLLLLALGLLLAYLVLRAYRRRVDGGSPPPGGAEDMVRCARCGLHLPRAESFTAGGEFFCCAEHRREHERR